MQILTDYQTLHTIPELDRHTPLTVSYIRQVLTPLRCAVWTPTEGSVCCFFDFGKDTAIAFRADIDGLPVLETTGLPWASRHPGKMHACGHDGHTAILLELARRLNQTPCLSHNVLLIFQPGEETDGGARDLCQSGILKTCCVTAIFGLHLWPGLPQGQIFSRPGAVMCRSSDIFCQITGKSVHIAESENGRDALLAAAKFCLETKNLSDDFLVKFGKIAGGTAGNILCGSVRLWGSLRSVQGWQHENQRQRLTALCDRICQEFGCQGSIRFSDGYPAVYNCPQLWQSMQEKCPVSILNRTFFTADDFSYYQAQVPGIYYFLGIGDTPPLHSPNFRFDPQILCQGADFFYRMCFLNIPSVSPENLPPSVPVSDPHLPSAQNHPPSAASRTPSDLPD